MFLETFWDGRLQKQAMEMTKYEKGGKPAS